jgi:hypothetical protein
MCHTLPLAPHAPQAKQDPKLLQLVCDIYEACVEQVCLCDKV